MSILQESLNTIEKLMQGEADQTDCETCLQHLRMALRAAPEHDTGAEAVGTITRSPLLDVEWTDVTQAIKLPIGTKLYTQPAHGERKAAANHAKAAFTGYERGKERGIAEGLERAAKVCDERARLTAPTTNAQTAVDLAVAIRSLAPAKQPDAEGGQVAGNVKPDNARQIFFYEQDFYVLSNFSAFNVSFRDVCFDTSEHAYHYQRFTDQRHLNAILATKSAHEAFRYAQDNKVAQRPDWDLVKVDTMREILRAKVDQHEYVRRKLLQTGDRELIEDSWRDGFWGWGENRDGHNTLGKLWMSIRAELQAALPAVPEKK